LNGVYTAIAWDPWAFVPRSNKRFQYISAAFLLRS
jgi:hypothetical protein